MMTRPVVDRWKTPDDLTRWLSKRFDRLVAVDLEDPSASIDAFQITTPDLSAGAVAEHFATIRAWTAVWQDAAASEADLEVEFADWETRNFGRVRIPRLAQVMSVEGAARLLRRTNDLISARKRHAELSAVDNRFSRMASHWPALVRMTGTDFGVLCRFLQEVARLGLHRMRLREVPCAGMHTKFLEHHRALLGPIMAALDIPANPDGRSWVGRLGFVEDDTRLFELRDLDGGLLPYPHFALPAEQLVACPVSATDAPALYGVVIVENQATFRALPGIPGVVAIFGRGDAVRSLGSASWLTQRPLLYSGDLDYAGFQMVAALRRDGLANLETALMDAETAMAFRVYWVDDTSRPGTAQAYDGLTDVEADAQRLMGEGPWRLEQERIPFDIWVERLKQWRGTFP
jgi:hypothetical protein